MAPKKICPTSKLAAAFATGLMLTTMVIAVPPALAHRNPSTCSGTGVAIALDPFEDRGFCSVSSAPCTHENEAAVCTQPGEICLLNAVGSDSVSQCQTIFYQASLAGFPGKCAFSSGTLTITLPDGSIVDVTPGGGIPCIGGSVTPAPPCNNPPVVSSLVPYSITPADVTAGSIVASTHYTGGTTHDTTNDTAGSESGSTGKTNFVNSCDDNNKCTTDTCDPNGIGTDACTNTPVVCNDNNACTTESCNAATGTCDTSSTTTCDDNNACTTEACNTTTGACDTSQTTTCDDNNPCTQEVCNATTGACDTTSTNTCDDNNACTTESCNTTSGSCETTATTMCTDNNACTTEACNATTGTCQTTQTTTCNDNNACTTESCNATTGACDSTDISNQCDDNNPCTDDSCDPMNGCTHTPNENPACALHHYQCYEVKRFAFTPVTATVQDRYLSQTVTLRSPHWLCAPSDKRGEDPTAPQDPAHLVEYDDFAGPVHIFNQSVSDQFGTVHLDLTRRAGLYVPSAKSLVSSPPALNPVTLDHFQCYGVRRSRGTPPFQPHRGIGATDQFGPQTADLLRPRFLCVPANKNNEDPTAPTHTNDLLCYRTRNPVKFSGRKVFTNNQLGPLSFGITHRDQFCVPAVINP